MDCPESSFVRDPSNLSYWSFSYLLHISILTFERLPRAARGGMVVLALDINGDARHIVAKAAVAVPEAGKGVGVRQPPRSPGLRQGEAGPLLTAEIVRLSKREWDCARKPQWIHFIGKFTIPFDTLSWFFGWHWFRPWYKFDADEKFNLYQSN